jgi:hypothetical protein
MVQITPGRLIYEFMFGVLCTLRVFLETTANSGHDVFQIVVVASILLRTSGAQVEFFVKKCWKFGKVQKNLIFEYETDY